MRIKQKRLCFICPTDHLESIINKSFQYKNYYYTSLGNSVVFNNATLNQIENLILTHNIKEISFILSNTNSIVLDALGNQSFSEIRGLDNCYHEIIKQKKYSDIFLHEYNREFYLLSHYLNKKIKELQLKLNNLIIDQAKIDGKIYNKQEGIFDSIYTNLISDEYFSLN